jgi:hypothetical protein
MRQEEAIRWHQKTWKGGTFWVRDQRSLNGEWLVSWSNRDSRFVSRRKTAVAALQDVIEMVEVHQRNLR